MTTSRAFSIDEEPLRDWILKGHHTRRKANADCLALTEAVREVLSGPHEGTSVPGQYFFEAEPDSSLWLFGKSLDVVVKGLDRTIYDPLLAAIAKKQGKDEGKLAPNLSLYVASLAGPIALKTGVDETVVCSLIATALLTLARLGTERVEKALKKS